MNVVCYYISREMIFYNDFRLLLDRCNETLLLVANFLRFCISMSLASHARPLYLFFDVLIEVCGIYKLGPGLKWFDGSMNHTSIELLYDYPYLIKMNMFNSYELLNLLKEKNCVQLIANLNSILNFWCINLKPLKGKYTKLIIMPGLSMSRCDSVIDKLVEHHLRKSINATSHLSAAKPFVWCIEYIKCWW